MKNSVRKMMTELLDDDLDLDVLVSCKQCGNREAIKLEEAISQIETKKKKKKPSIT